MTTSTKQPDISVRGGVINVPHSTVRPNAQRHQPNTPPGKKRTKVRADHQIPTGDPSPPVKASPPPQPDPPDKPTPEPAAQEIPPPDEPTADLDE